MTKIQTFAMRFQAKSTLIFIAVIIMLTGCVSKLEKDAYDALHPSLLNPKSYSLISIEKTGEVMYYENLDRIKRFHKDGVDETLKGLDSLLAYSREYADDAMYIEAVDMMFRSLSVDSAMVAFLIRESAVEVTDCAVGTEYAYRFHAENERGELAPHLYRLYTDTNDSVYYVGEERYVPMYYDAVLGYRDTLDYWIKKMSE